MTFIDPNFLPFSSFSSISQIVCVKQGPVHYLTDNALSVIDVTAGCPWAQLTLTPESVLAFC